LSFCLSSRSEAEGSAVAVAVVVVVVVVVVAVAFVHLHPPPNVISTEAAHSHTVSGAAEKPASPPPPKLSPSKLKLLPPLLFLFGI
jgi:hypothetical protein